MNRRTGLIHALDVTDREKALAVAEAVEPHVDAVKVNYPLVLSQGLEFLDHVPGTVVADLKVADIPNTNRLIAEQVNRYADALIAHAFPGRDSLESCVEHFDGDVYAVVEMSHPGAEQIFKRERDDLIQTALEADVDGVIAPATRPQSLRAIKEKTGLDLLSPGVGAQGGKIRETLEAGADYLIVGRAIYRADDPGAEAARIASEISNYL